MARRTICAGTAWTGACGSKHKRNPSMTTSLTFIDTNKLPRVKTPQGEVTEILNQQLVGAKNVLGTLRWLSPGEKFEAATARKTSAHLPDGRARKHPPGRQRLRCFPRRGRLSRTFGISHHSSRRRIAAQALPSSGSANSGVGNDRDLNPVVTDLFSLDKVMKKVKTGLIS